MPTAVKDGAAAGKGGRQPLGELVTEINTCLAIPDDAASVQQSSDGTGGANRVRVALPLLFDHLESDHGAPHPLRCLCTAHATLQVPMRPRQ
jgi:hypothetical protein